jgi:hypothetical protein
MSPWIFVTSLAVPTLAGGAAYAFKLRKDGRHLVHQLLWVWIVVIGVQAAYIYWHLSRLKGH